jgi:hypothetical protein
MSTTDGTPDRDEPGDRPGRPTEAGRRRGRILVPALIVGVILAIFAFILLVSQLGGDDSEIYQDETGSAPLAVVVTSSPR